MASANIDSGGHSTGARPGDERGKTAQPRPTPPLFPVQQNLGGDDAAVEVVPSCQGAGEA